jgi:radical SAM superfamily enzyme YgiQ (UPF0313 family)
MRIAFVSPNREQLPDPVIPLGILYMMAAVGDAHDKTLIDLCFETDPLASLATAISRFAPDLVAISMRNIQNADYTDTAGTLAWYRQVVATIRSATAAPLVIGGGGFSVIPHEVMADLGTDYGIVGEGEEPFAQLVAQLAAGVGRPGGIRNLLGGAGPADAPGLGRRDFLDLQANIRPERQWIDPRYFAHSGISSLQTKRGCSLGCDYCTYPLIEGRAIRQRPAADVADEWQAMLALHPEISHVFVVDSVFNLPPHHARAVCDALVERGNRTPWTCYLNPIRLDQSLADAMARAGCSGVEIGSDSGTDAGLARLKKGFDTARIRAATRTLHAAGIKDCHTFILGTRDESLDDVERSLDFVEALDPYGAILMAYKDDREAVDAGLAARLGEFRAQVLERIERRARPRSRWVVPSLGLRFNSRLFNALRRQGLRGPLWQHAPDRPEASASPAHHPNG